MGYSINPDGVIYLMNGTSGGQVRSPYSVDGTLYSYAIGSFPASWAEFIVEDDALTVAVKYIVNNREKTYYSWGIIKN